MDNKKTGLLRRPYGPPRNDALYRLAFFTAVASFLLIVAGGLVTSTDSGLSVPDWPLSYGRFFPPMVGGIRFEHSHRMIAGAVGLLTLLLTLWVLRREKRTGVRRLAIFALLNVLLQAVLGGATVLMKLNVLVSVAHALVGQTFFAMVALLAATLSPQWKKREDIRPDPTLGVALIFTTATIYSQLFLGAVIRHAGWQPPLLLAHLVGALGVGASVLWTGILVFRRHKEERTLVRSTWRLLGLFVVQVGLGAATFSRGAEVALATAHVGVGALLLAQSVVLSAHLLRISIRCISDTSVKLSAYLELTKPRLTGLAVMTTLSGFLLGFSGNIEWGKLWLTLLGTALIGGGAGALNQVLERQADALMMRTRRRPIPSGRLGWESALTFGVTVSLAGLFVLTFWVHPLTGVLAVATLLSYLFLYTPMKQRTPLCTLVGAIPGAIPPLIGWAASRGTLGVEAWILFAILFLWQLPHFLAIAWTYREDYSKAGFKMLPILDPEGRMTGRQIALYSAALVPVSLFPTGLGLAGVGYLWLALVSSLAFFGMGLATARVRSADSAHRLFLASVVYLPWLLITMTVDRLIS